MLTQKEEREWLLKKKSPDQLVDMVFELRDMLSKVVYVNQQHCDLLAEYIVNYCKDKFNAAEVLR